MGQELVSTMGLYEPSFGWHEVDNTGIAGEYQAVAIDAAGITANQVLDLQERLTATQAQLEAQEFTELGKDRLLGDMLYTAVLSYFAVNDIADRASVSTANVVTYQRPSFGRFTAVGQSRFLFGIALTVDFPGLEMDIDRFVSIVVSKDNDGDAQRAEVFQKGYDNRRWSMSFLSCFLAMPTTRTAVGAIFAMFDPSRLSFLFPFLLFLGNTAPALGGVVLGRYLAKEWCTTWRRTRTCRRRT